MPQFARPNNTLLNEGGWLIEPLGFTAHEVLSDESQGNYIHSTEFVGPPNLEVSLSGVTDPQTSADHVLVIDRFVPSGRAATIDLREGGIVRASITITVGFGVQTYTLMTSEADTISNYSNLTLYISTDQAGIEIYSAYLRVPSLGVSHLDYVSGVLTVVPRNSGNYLKLQSGVITRFAGEETTGALIYENGGITGWDGTP